MEVHLPRYSPEDLKLSNQAICHPHAEYPFLIRGDEVVL